MTIKTVTVNKPAFTLLLLFALPAFSAQDVSVAGTNISGLRGFNLLDRFDIRTNDPHSGYQEDDFKWISGFGFNFVRLPLDYRLYVKGGGKKEDWCDFDETGLKFVDQAIEYGRNTASTSRSICTRRPATMSSRMPRGSTMNSGRKKTPRMLSSHIG